MIIPLPITIFLKFCCSILVVYQHLHTFTSKISDALNFQFNPSGICETRLNGSISVLYKMNGYMGYFQNKSTTSGMLDIYLHNNIQAFKVEKIPFHQPHTESLFLKVTHPVTFLVGHPIPKLIIFYRV